LESEPAQLHLATKIAQQGLSVRQVESMVASRGAKPRSPDAAEAPPIDPNVRAASLELERVLGTRVKILGNGGRGKIEISYFSAQDLNRIYDLIIRQ
jgi:ParB family chromosome partitioning protein